VHCFVLLGVSSIQMKLNRVRAKQCYSISEFRFKGPVPAGRTAPLSVMRQQALLLTSSFKQLVHLPGQKKEPGFVPGSPFVFLEVLTGETSRHAPRPL
jgi:hypothetical protein